MGVIADRGGRELSVAIIGAGAMAAEHIKAFSDIPGVRVSGIYNRTRSRAETLAQSSGVPYVANSIPDLFQATKADLVVIAVLEMGCHDVAKAAFQFPWSCLMEKPAGHTYSEASAIADAARGKQVFVALNRRYNSSTLAATAALAEVQGKRFINIYDQQNIDDAVGMGHPRVVAENFMYANSVHVIDLMRVFGRGDVTRVTPVMEWDLQAPGVVLAKVDFASGDVGFYQGIWDGPGPWAVTVTTADERWELRPLEQAMLQKRGERTLAKIEVDPVDQRFKAGFRRQAEAVCDALRGRPSTAVSIDDALKSMHLIAQIFGHETRA